MKYFLFYLGYKLSYIIIYKKLFETVGPTSRVSIEDRRN